MSVQSSVSAPSSLTLSRAAERARKLLQGLAGQPRLLEALRRAGFSPEEAALGVHLSAELHRLQVSGPVFQGQARSALDAQRDLAGEGMLFVRAVGAAMVRLGTPAALRIAGQMDPAAPPAFAVDTALSAIEQALAAGDAEAAALDAALARRGYGPERRAEMRVWVQQATGQLFEAEAAAPNAVDPAVPGRILEVQLALYRWWQEWSIVARARAVNRRELIMVGLAQPRRRSSTEAAVEAEETLDLSVPPVDDTEAASLPPAERSKLAA